MYTVYERREPRKRERGCVLKAVPATSGTTWFVLYSYSAWQGGVGGVGGRLGDEKDHTAGPSMNDRLHNDANGWSEGGCGCEKASPSTKQGGS